VDTTYPVGQVSQTNPVTGFPDQDYRSADDWVCLDGTPIYSITWWGDYHQYLDDNPGPVNPPDLLPESFILRQYTNDASDPSNAVPGDLITEVEIPIGSCNQEYVQTVPVADSPGVYIHIFKYSVILIDSWVQDLGNTYWISIQAKFAVNPQEQVPIPFIDWEWLNTSPKGFLGTGVVSSDGGTSWNSAEYGAGSPYTGREYNFAFELSPAVYTPFNLRLADSILPTTSSLGLRADVIVEGTPYTGVPVLPYIMVNVNGTPYYILSGNKLATKATPYITNGSGKNKYFKFYYDVNDVVITDIPFVDLPVGTYTVFGAFLDSDGRLVGQIATRYLTIQ